MSSSQSLHPDAELLRAYLLGKLPQVEQSDVELHIAICKECSDHLERLGEDESPAHRRSDETVVDISSEKKLAPRGSATERIEAPPELAAHDRYRLLSKLGAGGMGEVYHAVHRLMDREVALKVIHVNLTRNPSVVRRFLVEVKAAARLHHPNIVTAHDAEQVGPLHFLVMEYVDGLSLNRLVAKNGALPIDQACHIIRQAALGLQHAHDRDMVHRDIKPHNLMVTRKGQVKILDFGLARLAETIPEETEGKRPLTTLGTVLGTPDYIAPEQVSDSHAVDSRADIYSLGCTFYFLLTGQVPFPEGSALQKALAHVDMNPRSVRDLRPDVPFDLLPILGRMMAKAPRDRYQKAVEVAQALTPYVRGTQPASSGRRVDTQPIEGNPVREKAPPPSREAMATPTLTRPPGEECAPPVAPSRRERPRPPRAARRRRSRHYARWLWFAGATVAVAAVGWLMIWGAQQLLASRRANVAANNSSGTTPQGELSRVAPVGANVAAPTARPRILIVLPERDYWNPDYANLRKVLDAAGVRVTLASTRLEPITSAPDGGGADLKADLLVHEAKADDYDAVICSGGVDTAALLDAGARGSTMFKEMLARGKPVAGVCGGPTMLAKAGVLQGRQVTVFGEHAKRFAQMGIHVRDEPLVVDGTLLTARDDQSAGALAEAIVNKLQARGGK